MKKHLCRRFLMIAVSGLLLSACGGSAVKDRPVAKTQRIVDHKKSESVIEPLDVNQDIENMTMQELRLLRSRVYARHGMLFHESDLRDYWKKNTVWYDTLSRSRYEKTRSEDIPMLSPDEQAFVGKIDNRMLLLQPENYIRTDHDTSVNIMNIVNLFQYAEIKKQQTLDDLAFNGYAIVADTLPQLFMTYRRNDSLHLPSFVTVDLLTQLSYVYESYMLRTVEREYYIPMLAELCLSMYNASMEQVNKATKEDVKDIAGYNAAFYAIPYILLTGKQLKIPETYQISSEEELTYIAQQEDHRPALMTAKSDFPYGAFKPHGHYTHTAELRRYFKALKWLQLAPYCGDDKMQLQQAVFAAGLLNSARTKSGQSIGDVYRRLFESGTWLYGRSAYPSISDIADLLKKERIVTGVAPADDKTLAKVTAELKKIKTADDSEVAYAPICRNGIYFMPQPCYADEKILRAMVDQTKNAERAFPKALDVLAAFGSRSAFDKLFIDNREDTLWTEYSERMAEMKTEMNRFDDWNGSLYDKRLECLLALSRKLPSVPLFMRNRSWNDKNLKTASASWVKAKHDLLLYGAIPEYPDPIDTTGVVRGGLPEPIVLGYVEPNLLFWKKLRERIELTDKVLKKFRLTTDTLNLRTESMLRYISFAENATRKELNNERLSEEEYRFIEHIGADIEQFTLSMIEPSVDRWAYTAGSDKSAAVLEEIYQRNVPGCKKNGIGYAATGYADNIYVPVEIGGYIYLTKGAVFGYYEFPMPARKDFGEKDRDEMLKQLITGDSLTQESDF